MPVVFLYKGKMPVRNWLLLAALLRMIAAFTRVNWHYPDEWFQTVEFSQLLLNGSATYSHEMSLHLRNLSWPLLLSVPLKLAELLAPHWTHLRLILVQMTAGLFDFAALLAFVRLSRGFSGIFRNLGLALLILPWFRVQDSVSLGAEHICVCLIWIALAMIAEKRWILAGFLSVAIFAVKYPAGLVTLGFFLALAFRREWRSLGMLSLGALMGAVIFGAGDWIFYGRPWESAWMYLQYNVFTDSALKDFGRDGLEPYFEFFSSRWFHVLFLLGVPLIISGLISAVEDFKKIELWAWAFWFYLLGHLLVSHREARFMFPCEALLLWGALRWLDHRSFLFALQQRARMGWLFFIIFAINLPLFMKATFAESGTLNSSYFRVDQELREHPQTCAVISQRPLNSLLIPKDSPPLAYFAAQRRIPTFPQAAKKALAWYGVKPQCSLDQEVLLLVDHPDVTWVERGCKLQRSGVLTLLPQSLWIATLRRGWVSGPWYVCPSSILPVFQNPVVEDPFFHRLPHFDELPALGISSKELAQFASHYSEAPRCQYTCD